jgi:hypothetical protein
VTPEQLTSLIARVIWNIPSLKKAEINIQKFLKISDALSCTDLLGGWGEVLAS